MSTAYTQHRALVSTYHEESDTLFTRQRVLVVDGNVDDLPTPMFATQVRGKVMSKQQDDDPNTGLPEGLKITQVRGKIMRTRTPNFGWIDMFVNELFPFDISYNSMAKTVFSTDVTMVDSGFTQRRSRWSQPLMAYDVAYGVRTREQLHGLIQFFRAMEGQKHAFRYKDHMDCQSNFAVREEQRRLDPITPLDQLIGIGDGSTYQFQLIKTYVAGSKSKTRPITKPVADTVRVAVDEQEVSNFTVNSLTGIVTFKTPHSITINDVVVTTPSSGTARFTGANGQFAGFTVGDRIETGGFLNTENNSTSLQTVLITAKGANNEYIETNRPNNFGIAATNQDGVTFQIHPAPKAGLLIHAGYEFHVPVRFETDELPMDFQYYGIGSAGGVRLIEVRPSELELDE